MRNLAVVLPISEPSDKHYHFVRQLSGEVRQIVIVDDGAEEDHFFDQMQAFSNVAVLHHLVPRGIGVAFRTAFDYLVNHGRELDGAILVRDTEELFVQSACNMVDQFIATSSEVVFGETEDSEAPSAVEKVMLNSLASDYQTLQMPMIACDHALFGYLRTLPGNDDVYLFNVLLLIDRLHTAFVEVPIKAGAFEWQAGKTTLAKAAKDVQDDPSVLLVP